jgi:hypothetical protein
LQLELALPSWSGDASIFCKLSSIVVQGLTARRAAIVNVVADIEAKARAGATWNENF